MRDLGLEEVRVEAYYKLKLFTNSNREPYLGVCVRDLWLEEVRVEADVKLRVAERVNGASGLPHYRPTVLFNCHQNTRNRHQ